MTPEEHIPERTRRAEERREFRRLLDATSLGTPGAKAMCKRATGAELTPEEQQAAAAELRDLEQEMDRRR